MNLKNTILFIIPTLIWGSTWYAIKFQLGDVNPILSVAYRFGIAGVLLIIGCKLFKINLRFNLNQHLLILLQGAFLFSLNYMLVYFSERYLTSGLVSVLFSLIIFLNIFFNWLILKAPIKKDVFIGGIFGVTGTVLIFKNEFSSLDFSDDNFIALILGLISAILASLGNIISAYNQKKGLPVIQTNAYGMFYGSILMFIVAIISGIDFTFSTSFSYVFSLLYLAIFGSIIAFTAYLNLLGNIGPDRSAYTILVIPIIAMIISTIFEGYIWQNSAIIGILFLLAGNFMVMNKKYKIKILQQWK
ncbi:DMT family transporter [Bacteroidota bacterium]